MQLTKHHQVISAAEGARLEVSLHRSDAGFTWSVTNQSDFPAEVRSISEVYLLTQVEGELAMFRHGYQSWSQSNVAKPGLDVDPSTVSTVEMVTMTQHADQRRTRDAQLRSEMVTVMSDNQESLLIGFLGGHLHDGTIRVDQVGSDFELSVEAFLGSVELMPGETRALHEVVIRSVSDPIAGLDAWASDVGKGSKARVQAEFQVGWCSWYHYFDQVTEQDLLKNLELAADWPFDVVQLDDGFQSEIGDWLVTNEKFPSGLKGIADSIAAAGFRPGLWIAPFGVSLNSRLAHEHPEWIAKDFSGEPLIGMFGPHWGGFVHTLDVTNPEVLEHLESLARELVQLGFSYLKLDFTYSPGFDGIWADRSMTPAQRVRAGFDAIRRGAGEDAFILGCGAPLGACIGVVDGMRIGSDVAPFWAPKPELWPYVGYEQTIPSTKNAWRNTLTRAHQHRRLWLNDPDCVMLRTSDTELTPEQVRAWALAVGASGGMVLVSDDLSLLHEESKLLLREVIELGQRSDAASRSGTAPMCTDLMQEFTPRHLEFAGLRLVGDPELGSARIEAVDS
jgi:alpha-galactosidase